VLTKPLHASQIVLKETDRNTIIQIELVLNFELEREILGFGPQIKVLSPHHLVKRIATALQQAAQLYQTPESPVPPEE
jgi:predicted DNA-binding transcriptional regulator YafY